MGVGGRGGAVLPYKDSTGMCCAKAPQFLALAAPKDSTFSIWAAPKRLPFQQYAILCSSFPTWAYRKDPRFKRVYVSLLFLVPKSPVFPVSGRSQSPIFSVRGRSLRPPFLNPVRHIYTNFIFEYPHPPPGFLINNEYFLFLSSKYLGQMMI